MDWKQRGVRVKQETNFPESERTLLTIEKTPSAPWALRLRIPAWTSAENSVSINGKRLEAAGTPGSYLTLTRAWKAGDRVELTMPMRVTAEPTSDDRRSRRFYTGRWCWPGNSQKRGSTIILSTTRARRSRSARGRCAIAETGRRRTRRVDQTGCRRGIDLQGDGPGGRRNSQAPEPKLATLRGVLEGDVGRNVRAVYGDCRPEIQLRH